MDTGTKDKNQNIDNYCCLEELVIFHEKKLAEQKALKNLLKALTKNKEN